MRRRRTARDRLLSVVTTICGIAIAVVPLALWMAPTVSIFKLVLIGGGGAFLIIIALAKIFPDAQL